MVKKILIELGGKLWQKFDKNRIYFDQITLSTLYGLDITYTESNSYINEAYLNNKPLSKKMAKKILKYFFKHKFYFDLNRYEFISNLNEKVKEKILYEINERLEILMLDKIKNEIQNKIQTLNLEIEKLKLLTCEELNDNDYNTKEDELHKEIYIQIISIFAYLELFQNLDTSLKKTINYDFVILNDFLEAHKKNYYMQNDKEYYKKIRDIFNYGKTEI